MSDDVAKDEAPAIYRLVLLLVVGTSFSFFSSKRFRERESQAARRKGQKKRYKQHTDTQLYRGEKKDR